MAVQERLTDNFKEHSIAEFFKKNKQMLGFSGQVRSLTTVIHELVSNSLDACEEHHILPDIKVEVSELGKGHYKVRCEDNGPGIPEKHLGKALGQMLAGTKFHRYMQQRGQQGIGAAGCTMYAILTTGKGIQAVSMHKGKKISCDVGIDFKSNSAVLSNITYEDCGEQHGLIYEGEFKEVKYERSNYGIYEYLRRTALANPHCAISLKEPNGDVTTFARSVHANPPRPTEVQPHPLGIGAHELLDMAHYEKEYRKLSSFLQEKFARVSSAKIQELKVLAPEVDFDKDPHSLEWTQAEKIVDAFKQVKWISPATDSIVPIGKEQIETSFKNIFNPEVLVVTERPPKVYKGGVVFAVEVGIAYGGGVAQAEKKGEIMRFANRVPLLFDTAGCAITETVKAIEWKRYDVKEFAEEPIAILVNLVSVYVPYTSAGKQAISQEEEVMDEIKNAVQEAARSIQRYLSGQRRAKEIENRRKVVARYVEQLSYDLSELAGTKDQAVILKHLQKIIEEKYANSNMTDDEEEKLAKKEEAAKEEEADEE